MYNFDKLWLKMKEKGITTYMLREKYSIDSRTIRRLKQNQNVTTNTLNKLCSVLKCDVADIIEFIPDEDNKNNTGIR